MIFLDLLGQCEVKWSGWLLSVGLACDALQHSLRNCEEWITGLDWRGRQLPRCAAAGSLGRAHTTHWHCSHHTGVNCVWSVVRPGAAVAAWPPVPIHSREIRNSAPILPFFIETAGAPRCRTATPEKWPHRQVGQENAKTDPDNELWIGVSSR